MKPNTKQTHRSKQLRTQAYTNRAIPAELITKICVFKSGDSGFEVLPPAKLSRRWTHSTSTQHNTDRGPWVFLRGSMTAKTEEIMKHTTSFSDCCTSPPESTATRARSHPPTHTRARTHAYQAQTHTTTRKHGLNN